MHLVIRIRGKLFSHSFAMMQCLTNPEDINCSACFEVEKHNIYQDNVFRSGLSNMS